MGVGRSDIGLSKEHTLKPLTKGIDFEGYWRTAKRWSKLTFEEALRELLDYYNYEEVEKEVDVCTISYRRRD